jgi:hypothetical protein
VEPDVDLEMSRADAPNAVRRRKSLRFMSDYRFESNPEQRGFIELKGNQVCKDP